MLVLGSTDLRQGMILGKDVYDELDLLVLSKGSILEDRSIALLIRKNIQDVYVQDDIQRPTLSSDKQLELLSAIEDRYRNFTLMGRSFYPLIANVVDSVLLKLTLNSDLLKYLNEIYDIGGYTFTHAVNTSVLSLIIGKLMGEPDSVLNDLALAGILADIGKLNVNRETLLVKTKLSEVDFKNMQLHVINSMLMLEECGLNNVNVLSAVAMHHERLDGTGYPDKLKGTEISKFARIVAIADVYDGITSDKHYATKMDYFSANDYLFSESLTRLDPNIVQLFIKKLQSMYLGMNVLLNTGESGEIVFINKYDPNRPLVRTNTEFYDLSRNREIFISEVI